MYSIFGRMLHFRTPCLSCSLQTVYLSYFLFMQYAGDDSTIQFGQKLEHSERA